MTTAAVNVNARGRLDENSAVFVAGRLAPVPAKAPVGGVLFWPRVNAALETLGYRLALSGTDDYASERPDMYVFNVEPVEGDES